MLAEQLPQALAIFSERSSKVDLSLLVEVAGGLVVVLHLVIIAGT